MNTTDTEIVQGIDVEHLTDEFDRVAIKMRSSGELVAVPGREDDRLPFECFEIVTDGVELSNYERVCDYVTEQARFDRPVSFGEVAD